MPNAEGFIDVVVGERGDMTALNNLKVSGAILGEIDRLNEDLPVGKGPSSADKYRALIRQKTAEQLGVGTAAVDEAIRNLARKTTDPHQREMAKRYKEDYGAPLSPDKR